MFRNAPPLRVPQDEGPVIVKVSGGASSGMMLAGLLEAGQLCAERGDLALFNNTTAEHPATYDFVGRLADACREFGIPFLACKYCTYEVATPSGGRVSSYCLERTDRLTMDGTAYEEYLAKRRFLPSTFLRTCTVDLKIIPTERALGDIVFRGWHVLPYQGHPGPPVWDIEEGYKVHTKKGGVTVREMWERMHTFLCGRPTFRPRQVVHDYGGG